MIDDTANDQSSKKPACGPYHQSFSGSAQVLVDKVEKEIKKYGGSFSGNASSGTFSVMEIKGSYTINGQEIIITINSKPFTYSCDEIHDYIKKHIN